MLNGKRLTSILSARDEYEMKATDADAILSAFFILPDDDKLRKIFRSAEKPVFVYSRPNIPEISSKLKEGEFAICLKGKDVSNPGIKSLHKMYPCGPFVRISEIKKMAES